MPEHDLNPLVTPWWVLWDSRFEYSPVFKVLKEVWFTKLDCAMQSKGMNLTTFAGRLGRNHNWMSKRKSFAPSAHYLKSSLPIHELFMHAAALDVGISDLLPAPRDLYVRATDNLIQDYEKQQPDDDFALIPEAIEAYVEYHFACPQPQLGRRPDQDAVAQAYHALESKFKNIHDASQWIAETAAAVERIYYHHDRGGKFQ